jgi:tRNA threonylcarbamoyladenosine biosynthesis protein TsaB
VSAIRPVGRLLRQLQRMDIRLTLPSKQGAGKRRGWYEGVTAGAILNALEGMLKSVNVAEKNAERMLLIDTCGDGAGVAVSLGEAIVAAESLPTSGGSAEIVAGVQRALQQAGWSLSDLRAIGVVSGPGSFTGVRVGMAAAKGFSEASQIRMVTVSRLQVLREAGPDAQVVALDAGRSECYVSDTLGQEWLGTTEAIQSSVGGGEVVVAEARVAARLSAAGIRVRTRTLSVQDALLPLLYMVREGNRSMTLADANYVRRESDIYAAGKRA